MTSAPRTPSPFHLHLSPTIMLDAMNFNFFGDITRRSRRSGDFIGALFFLISIRFGLRYFVCLDKNNERKTIFILVIDQWFSELQFFVHVPWLGALFSMAFERVLFTVARRLHVVFFVVINCRQRWASAVTFLCRAFVQLSKVSQVISCTPGWLESSQWHFIFKFFHCSPAFALSFHPS